MTPKKIAIIIFVFCFLFTTISSAAVPKRRYKDVKNRSQKSETVSSQIGLKIPEWGIAIDAIYNPELTGIIPGYHIINLVLSNHRGEPIRLDSRRDKWIIIDHMGKKHTAHNHVKHFDRDLWPQIPKRLQNLLDYPHSVSPGKSTTIDVFISKSVDLTNFRQVVWKSKHFDKEFNMMTNYEKTLKIKKNNNEFDTPSGPKQVNMAPGGQPPPQKQMVNYPSKYYPPKIGEVTDTDTQNKTYPTFDPSLDDTIIIRE